MTSSELDKKMMEVGINTAYTDFYFAVAEQFDEAQANMEYVENDDVLRKSRPFTKAYRVTMSNLVKNYVDEEGISDYEKSKRITLMKRLIRLRMKVRLRIKYGGRH